MRSWLVARNYRVILSILSIVLPIVAIIMGIISLSISQQTAKILEDINTSVEKNTVLIASINTSVEKNTVLIASINASVKNVTDRLENLEQRVAGIQTTALWSWVAWNLSSANWRDFLIDMQRIAANSTPRYVEPLSPGTFMTAPEGKNLLGNEHMEKIISMVEDNKDIPEREIVFALGIDKLYFQAQKKKVSFEIIIAVAVSYAQEQKYNKS